MPFKGLHAFRIQDPDEYDDFRMVKDEFGDGIHVVYGLKGEGDDRTSEVQSIRFEADQWEKGDCEDWLEENDFQPIGYEAPAAEESKQARVFTPPQSAWASVELEPRPDGQEPTKFRKELIREGDWQHPWSGEHLSVRKKDLSRWENQFQAMVDAGMKVPILQDHMPSVESGVGWVTAMELDRVDNDGKKVWALFGILEFGDDWAARILEGKVRDVSISIATVLDSHGGTWESVIDEVSVTLWPVIEGQTGFKKLSSQRAVGFSYRGPNRRSFLDRLRKEGGHRMAMRRKKERSVQEVDLAKLEARVTALETENETLKTDLSTRTTERDEARARLAAVDGEKVQACKATVLSAIKAKVEDEKALSPHAAEKLSAMVEEDFTEGMSLEAAEKKQEHLLGTLSAMTEKVIPDKRLVESGGNSDDGTLESQDLSKFVSGVLGVQAKR